MKFEQMNNFLKMGSISIPKFFLCNYRKLNISDEEFVVLMSLMSCGNKISYNPKLIAANISHNEKSVMVILSKLSEKRIIDILVEKNDNNMIEEFIFLDPFYEKMTDLIINTKEENKESDLYSLFEEEFGRTLSPMEYEIINGWINSSYKKEIIIEALREAIYNGVNNLRYIDKILYEWKKKNFKNVNEVRKYNDEFRKEKPEKKELFDYNWLEDEE